VLSTTTRVVASRSGPLLLAAAIAVLPFAALDILFAQSESGAPSLLRILSAIVNCWLYGVIAHVTLAEIERRPIDFGTASQSAMPLVGMVFGVTLVQGLMVLFGTLLLVLPGIFLWLWSYVALPVAVFERRGVWASIQRSGRLTAPHRLPILLLGLVILVPFVLLVGVAAVSLALAAGSPASLDDADLAALWGGDAAYYGITLASVVLEMAYTVFATVALTVVYARIREAPRVDGETVAEIFR
jgi:hypothetical protein